MARKKKIRKIAVIDTETDPFLFGRIPQPFCVEFYSDEITETFWGDDCMERLVTFLEELPDEYMIYAHNGGKFDFHFLHKWIDNPVKIINARIVSAKLDKHILRDSFAIIPVPLKSGGEKMEFDYAKMERSEREKHKTKILEYLHQDCIALYNLVVPFNERFGPQLTVGKTAITEIMKRHEFERMNKTDDPYFRRFYFGGRVECFGAGKLTDGPYHVYDVNSMYPFVMRNRLHPVNGNFDILDRLPDDFSRPFFLRFIGRNHNALPVATQDGLKFNQEEGEFFACSHELEIALKYGLVEIDRVIECAVANETISFKEFVDEFYAEKVNSKLAGDKVNELFAKFMLNSGYGKFGQNPENFNDWHINRYIGEDAALEDKGYSLQNEYEEFELWARPAAITDNAYYDVSIAASITSAARAHLLEGIQHADTPLYCDTDSLICKGFKGDISSTELGWWKPELTAPAVAIAGKKMYALYDPQDRAMVRGKKKPLKLTSKGGTLTLPELLKICDGGEVTFQSMAPTFSLKKPTTFIQRKFRMTVDETRRTA